MRKTAVLGILLVLSLFGERFARAQSEKEWREGRRREWTLKQVYRWYTYLERQPLQQNQLDCPDYTTRRDVVMNGNKITTQITNFGSISSPGNTITDIVWNGLGYGYEFGPFVAAEVIDEGHKDPQSVPMRDEQGNVVYDANGDTIWVMHIVSDGLVSNGGERSPDGKEWWGWQPIPCAQPVGSFEGLEVVNPESNEIPTSDAPDRDLDGRPDSWPESWYNPNLRQYVWPGALRQGASNADKEALYFMNDYSNREFHYYPFPDDSTKRGLGLEVEVRIYQWSNPLAEDAIFFVYKITNKSPKDLEKVIFGMWGDPHVGGPGDWHDDLAYFDRRLNMVYAWDADGRSDIPGRKPGYFGYKFLESPGIDYDGIDNDGDGMVDESWYDGIDNDGDWDPERDDVGIDGIPGTGDEGEGDGLPTPGDPYDIRRPGEPNIDFTDIDESDMIGLTSFASPPFAGNRISNDERVWSFVQPGRFDEVPPEPGDYVFIYGSGPFRLRAGETKRFSIALLMGENLDDLMLNAETVQEIYNAGYRFAKPPEKPHVVAVPGDRKVTLYWDDRAEYSVDPLSGENDFEGYVIYRSTDPEFADLQTITDINGTPFLYEPLKMVTGVPARFDRINGIKGLSPVPYPRRGVAYFLGNDTGLRHTFVDSNNVVNGQRYFYAVVAYDHGAPDLGIPPSETSKTITYNPETDTYIFDVNTVSVVPRPPAAGYVPPEVVADEPSATGPVAHVSGHGTGTIHIEVIDPMAVEDDNPYRLIFEEVDGQLVYSVIDEKPVEVTIQVGKVGKSAGLGYRNIIPETFELLHNGQPLQEGVDYTLNARAGRVIYLDGGAIEPGMELVARFQYRPIDRSNLLNFEEANPIFDGLHLFVRNDPLAIDTVHTGWVQGGSGFTYQVRVATAGPGRRGVPYDYEIRFANQIVDTSFSTRLPLPFRVYNRTRANEPVDVFVPDVNRNGRWDIDERIIFLEYQDGSPIATWEVRFFDPENRGTLPGEGDVFQVVTRKPFTTEDVFTFRTRAARTEPEEVRRQMREIYVVPNPYVATNVLEPRNPVSRTRRGDRRLYFANLPPRCTIRIYTLAGELVDVIEHDSPIDNGIAYWDLRSRDNMDIAYGLYIFHVESEEGTYVGKFAVIK